ncbi:MAG TPA: hypothetical protein VK010_00545, partial [Flavobacteriaceae bacterium]|nr:hypothetical protein [Flavobacteriaceae bacterium]
IIFNGKETPSSENIIEKMSRVPIIGRIEEEDYFDVIAVKKYAEKFENTLKTLIFKTEQILSSDSKN